MTELSNNPSDSRPARWRVAPLVAIGGVSALLYALVALVLPFSNAERDVAAFLAAFGALFGLYAAAAVAVRRAGEGHSTLALVLVFGVLFRVLMLCAGLPNDRPLEGLARDLEGRHVGYTPFLIYDNDVWRYLWEGHVSAHGIRPAGVPPGGVADLAELGEEPYAGALQEELWWDVLDNVSFHGHTTVYPVAAQWLFRLSHAIAPGSVFVWKSLVVLADLGTCWALILLLGAVGRARSEVLLWAWNPLVLKEFAGSGHVDAWLILPLTLAVYWLVKRSEGRALAAFGGSLLVKFGSAPLGLLFLRHSRWRAWAVLGAVLAAGLLPVAAELRLLLEGVAIYASDWVFNSGPWVAVREVAAWCGAAKPELWAHGVTKVAIVAAAVGLAWRLTQRPAQLVHRSFLLMAIVVLLNPAVMPWYLLWALPLAIASGRYSWIVLTATSLLSYLFYIDGVESAAWLGVEYGVFGVAAVLEARRLGSAGQKLP